jgi:CRISPR/Cas system-associated exonuclease Cas4 (RecB family)
MENDAITAYHFYRLLQRANSISLIYNLSSGGMNASEASRFIKQIELEMPIYNPAVKIKHHKIQFPLPTSQTAGEIIIEKTEEVQSQIEKYIREKSFSPSTLNNYKKCSYLFYLQKIVGLKKEQEVEEQMAYNTQGDLIHNTLEDFYNIFDGKPITTKEFENRKSEIMTIFNHRLETDYKNLDTSFGKNLLTKEILKQFLQHFIAIESEFAKQVQQYNIEGLELEVENSFIIDHQNSPLEIRFKGSADRIDSFGNTLRIVDYKTGAVDATHLAIDISRGQDQWEYMFNEKYDKAFQLMMYAWMYWKTAKPGIKLQSGIIAFKSHAAFLPLKLYKNEYISEADLQRFEEDLKVLIDDMLNPAIPFVQRNNDRVCEYCDYRQICMR